MRQTIVNTLNSYILHELKYHYYCYIRLTAFFPGQHG